MNDATDILSVRSLANVEMKEDERSSEISRAKAPRSGHPTAFRPDREVLNLIHQVFRKPGVAQPQMVVFAGVEHGCGCTRIAASTATMLANSGDLVCLLEVNFHSPSLSGLFGLKPQAGLAEALKSETPILHYAVPVSDDERLWLVPAGSVQADSIEQLTSARMLALLEQLRHEFAVIIIDAGPTDYSETLALGRTSDGVVLVLESDRTRRDAATAAVNVLRSSDVTLLGAVLNKRSYPIPGKLYSRL